MPESLEDIARKLDDYNKRLSHLERLEGAGALVLIEEIVLTIDTANIDFQNIPATFRHLEIFGNLRTDFNGTLDEILFTLNGDGGNNYDWRRSILRSIYATTEGFADTSMELASVAATTAPAGKFSSFTIITPNYASTIVEAGLIYVGGYLRSTSGANNIASNRGYGEWRDTAAVDRITIVPKFGSNFEAGSIISLYGIR